MRSSSGFGIGLYQANRLAELHGFTLKLTGNRNGFVQFTLNQSDLGVSDALGDEGSIALKETVN